MTQGIAWKCVSGHDLCNQMLPGPDCPYCEGPQYRKIKAHSASARARSAPMPDDQRTIDTALQIDDSGIEAEIREP